MKISFIGGGHMASALVDGLLNTGMAAGSIAVAQRNPDKQSALRDKGIQVVSQQEELPPDTDILVLAVKPSDMRAACGRLPESKAIFVSIAAGVPLQALLGWLSFAPSGIVRAMPNTPAAVGVGMSVCYGDALTPAAKSAVTALFQSTGEVVWLDDESLLDPATAVSGSGPAYFYYIAEIMEEAAVEMGLSPVAARQLVQQTISGGGAMLAQSGKSAADLRRAVAVPGGATERAIAVMKERQLKACIKDAMRACCERARELGKLSDCE